MKQRSLEAKLDALPFQQEAVDAIAGLEYAAIFHEQGLGKTKIAIDTGLLWIASKVVDCVLVVTKKGLIENWRKEIMFHSHLTPAVLSEGSLKSLRSVFAKNQILLAHYELFKTDGELIDFLTKRKRVGIVLDEAQKIKNPASVLSECFHSKSALFVRKLILTGTPVSNRPHDIWSQIFFLDQGESLGANFKQFKAKLEIPKLVNPNALTELEENKVHEFETALEEIFDNIGSFTVRETKKSSGIKLPKKEFMILEGEWEPEQRELYERVRDELSIEISVDAQLTEDVSENLLKKLLRLVQITSNPSIIDDRYDNLPGKVPVLDALCDSVVENKEKIIIWTTFTRSVDWLNRRYSKYGAVKIHGSMNIAERNVSVTRFLDDPDTKVMIASPAAAKEGLTLTVANHVAFFDRSFSLDDYLQAQDRIHRISQTKDCMVYNIILPDSIDEWVDSLIRIKGAAAALAQRDISRVEYKSLVKYDTHEILQHILTANEE
jgi:SNF2 family DNA or RNA helicase